jgi:outer membrane protein assembly factor BamB
MPAPAKRICGPQLLAWAQGLRGLGSIALLVVTWCTAAAAADVTVGVVVRQADRNRPLDQVQEVRRSPLGGWVVATACFGLRLGDTPLLDYRTAAEMIAGESSAQNDGAADAGKLLADFEAAGGPAEPTSFRFDRPAAALVSAGEGRQVIAPFGATFEIGPDGRPASDDPRLRVDADRRRVELVCHPVTIRTRAQGRTVAAPLTVTAGGRSLLGGLPALLGEYQRLAEPWREADDPKPPPALCRLTIFLPASAAEAPYEVAGRRFTVGPDGQIALDPSAQAARVEGTTILLESAAAPPRSTRPVAIQAWNLLEAARIIAGERSIQATPGASVAVLDLPANGPQPITLGSLKTSLPAATPEWPCSLVLWDAAAGAAWVVESPGLWAKPGDLWRCRVTPVAGQAAPLGRELPVRFEPAGRDGSNAGQRGPEARLTAESDGVFAGPLPQAAGLHRIVAAGTGQLAGRTLGHVWLADAAPTGSVSILTVNNRGLVRRGDTLEVFQVHQGAAPAAALPLVLRGMGIEKPLGQALGLRLETALLAPGGYEITAGATAGQAVYPLRFRVCQREPESGYELYSWVYSPARPMAGSPINAFYGRPVAGEPGLAPFLADVDAAAPLLAAYANEPAGPVADKCRPLPAGEAALLALALLGGRSVPAPPQMLHHEEWNPKHSLPEELARIRRRLALVTQLQADVAGFGGMALNQYATLKGYWEESLPLDGHQQRRNERAEQEIAARVEERVAAAREAGSTAKQLELVAARDRLEVASGVLPTAYAEYLTDARAIRPDLSTHTGIPSFWLGSNHSFPPVAYASLSHRDSFDYTDYGVSPWGNFRVPAFLGMGNPAGQPLQASFMTRGRGLRIATAFGAAGRGLDGLSLALDDEHPVGEDAALLAIFRRFGPFFSALEPRSDAAVYFSGWANQASVVLHDLARLRRPGELVSEAEVRAGKLAGMKVLFLAGIGGGEPADILAAFAKFAADGGTIVKDDLCDPGLPGRPLGFGYDTTHVHKAWGLAYPDGESEFAHLWKNFKQTREAPLVAAFATAPRPPVSTPTPDVVIAPLAGSESILVFSINQTLVPLEVAGKWRQHTALPCRSTLLVEAGWHVHDLLAGRAVAVTDTPAGPGVPLDFTRCEGAIHLLTRRRPESLAIRTLRPEPGRLRLAAWLADGEGKPLPDPLPFEVTLRARDQGALFHAFVAASPTLTVDVPVPAAATDSGLELVVRDLLLGCTATERIEPAPPAAVAADTDADLVGGREAIIGFRAERPGPVAILLDEGQEPLRPAAEKLAAQLAERGREATIVVLDPAEVRPLPLRWVPRPEDEAARAVVESGGLGWRIDLASNVLDKAKTRVIFDDPRCGYAEYGPRLDSASDLVLFGLPQTNRAIADLAAFLRRRPSENLPAAEGFFVEYLRSPFRGGRDGLLIACRDPAGAAAAVARLETLALAAAPPAAAGGEPPAVETKGGPPAPPEDLASGRFGTRILDATFAPDGRIFVTADTYGDSFFVVDEAGKVVDSRPLGNRLGNSIHSLAGGRLFDVTATGFGVTLGQTPLRYDLERGWVGRIELPPTGFNGRFSVPIAASTVLPDATTGRSFIGGARGLRCLDAAGKQLWRFDDTALRAEVADLLHPRSLFPRGITPDGRHLLVAGFGIEHDCYRRGKAVNASILALDAANGNLLWQQDGLLLNQGQAVPLPGRFLVIDDGGGASILGAADGRRVGELGGVRGSNWTVPVAAADSVLVVENNAFDRAGRAARAYLRPLAGGADRPLAVAGRVTDLAVSPAGDAVTLATERGVTQRFAADGTQVWQAATPSGGIVRQSPAGDRVLVGGRTGTVHLLDARDGATRWTLDLNPFNVTTPARFVTQQSPGEVPLDTTRSPPPDPLEPSWLDAPPAPGVTCGKPLVERRGLAAGRGAPVAIEKGKTYLVELVAAADPAASLTPLTRLEVEVTGLQEGKEAAQRWRLPLGSQRARRRLAFRADRTGTATLTLRAVEPVTVGEGRKARRSYDQPAASPVTPVIEDAVVAELRFPGRDIVYDGGPKAASRPLGDVTASVVPWTGGNTTLRSAPYPCPAAALRLVNGRLDEPDAAWTKEVGGEEVARAEARVKLSKPQTIAAVAIYEDPSGPVPTATAALETVSPRFAVYAKEAGSGSWRRLGSRFDNESLVNVLAGPDGPVDELLYVWAGRDDAATIDGLVRPTELEIYAGDDLETLLDDPLEDDDDLGP